MTHEDYMRQALALAREAAAAAEVPVGCVIVDRAGQIIGRGRNRREEDKSPLAHAELAAITDACRSHGDWRLKGARLYVTLEPCPMCAGGILSARIPESTTGPKTPASEPAGLSSTSLRRTSATTTKIVGLGFGGGVRPAPPGLLCPGAEKVPKNLRFCNICSLFL